MLDITIELDGLERTSPEYIEGLVRTFVRDEFDILVQSVEVASAYPQSLVRASVKLAVRLRNPLTDYLKENHGRAST